MMKKQKRLIMMRGPSGSGKTTFARREYPDAIHCSADEYFEDLADLNGTTYADEFQPWLLSQAHQHCYNQFIHAIKIDEPIIVIDNTNICIWEMENYVLLASHFDYKIEVQAMPKQNPHTLAERNAHGVPLHIIERQMKNYEHAPWYYGDDEE